MPFDLKRIKHVVVLMLENRSFDHMLGALPKVNGVKSPDYHGESAFAPGDDRVSVFEPDAPHKTGEVLKQIQGFTEGGQHFDGVPSGAAYVRTYENSRNPAPNNPRDVLKHYAQGALPVTHDLASKYLVCDRWFCSVPSSTMPNRLYSMCGDSGEFDSNGKWKPYTETPIKDPAIDKTSIFDLLDDKDWAVYCGGLSMGLMLGGLEQKLRFKQHMRSMKAFEKACRTGKLPALSWIEPNYDWMPKRNDDHPPTPVEAAQGLIAEVYNRLVFDTAGTESAWPSSVLIVTYDEHGGFYDHVRPDPIPASARSLTDENADPKFTHYGPRVPALVVSGFVPKGGVFSQTLEHCSILKFLCEWKGLDATKLSSRVASAETRSLAEVFELGGGDPTPHVIASPPATAKAKAKPSAKSKARPAASQTEQQAAALKAWIGDHGAADRLSLPVLKRARKPT